METWSPGSWFFLVDGVTCRTGKSCLSSTFWASLSCSYHHNTSISVSCEPCQWYRGWKSVGFSDHCSYRSYVTNAAGRACTDCWCLNQGADVSHLLHSLLLCVTKMSHYLVESKVTRDQTLIMTLICPYYVFAMITLLEKRKKKTKKGASTFL